MLNWFILTFWDKLVIYRSLYSSNISIPINAYKEKLINKLKIIIYKKKVCLLFINLSLKFFEVFLHYFLFYTNAVFLLFNIFLKTLAFSWDKSNYTLKSGISYWLWKFYLTFSSYYLGYNLAKYQLLHRKLVFFCTKVPKKEISLLYFDLRFLF